MNGPETLSLGSVFTPERIKIPLESQDKDELFEELVDVVVNAYQLDQRDEIVEAVRRREERMSTGIKKGIAMPHGKVDSLDGVYGVIGLSSSGIEYDALDGEPVYLVYLLVCGTANLDGQLRLLRRIAVLNENYDYFADIMDAGSRQAANDTIVKYERILGID